MANAKTRQKILKTFLTLLEDHAYGEIGFQLLADQSGISLSDLRANFASKTDLVAAFAEMIDRAVLEQRDSDMTDQPVHDRLFDVLMTRIDCLTSYKGAVRALMQAGREDPALLVAFNRISVRSQKWMLAAAGLPIDGVRARVSAQGLAFTFARTIETWLEEDDEGMPRTMARLDKELERGGIWMKRFERFAQFGRRAMRAGAAGRRKRRAAKDAREAKSADHSAGLDGEAEQAV